MDDYYPTKHVMNDFLMDNYDTTVEALLYIDDVDREFVNPFHKFPIHKKTRYKIIRQAAAMMPKWSQKFRDEPSEKHIFERIEGYQTQEDAQSEFMSILYKFGISERSQNPAFNKKILNAISKLPKRKVKSQHKITKSDLEKMIDECFKHTIKLGMLEQERIDHAVIKIFNKPKGATKAGIHNGKISMQFNFGLIVIHSPDEILSERDIDSIINKNVKEQYKAIRKAQLRGKWARIEYISFWKDKDIGLWIGNNEKDGWRMIVAHEMAHVVNYNSVDDKWRGRGHGAEFKKVYKILRKKMLS